MEHDVDFDFEALALAIVSFSLFLFGSVRVRFYLDGRSLYILQRQQLLLLTHMHTLTHMATFSAPSKQNMSEPRSRH